MVNALLSDLEVGVNLADLTILAGTRTQTNPPGVRVVSEPAWLTAKTWRRQRFGVSSFAATRLIKIVFPQF
jgi:hypothetical protein